MTIQLTKTHWAIALVLSFAVMLIGAGAVHANPYFFAPSAATATATTSPAFMTAGLATSTITYDSYNLVGTNQPIVNDPTAPLGAALEMQFIASSTSSVLNIAIERSDDNIDWYQDQYSFPVNATTTGPGAIALPITFAWTFASSTIGGQTVANNNRIGKIIRIETPTRYTRAIFTLTGTNGAVWAKFVPIKQNK